jgi:methyl-accepting chemotaxis protein
MVASARDISMNTSANASVAGAALQRAETAGAIVADLAASSEQIGAVVQMIGQIAEQTNLLALNATIEAARAGDAGKGFAVVASEVKDLANETAKAADDVSTRVQAIQSQCRDTVAAIEAITAVINQVAENTTSVSSAIEEQSATTSEIGRSSNEIAGGANQIAHSVTEVATAAVQTSIAASAVHDSADTLTGLAGELGTVVATLQGRGAAGRRHHPARGARLPRRGPGAPQARRERSRQHRGWLGARRAGVRRDHRHPDQEPRLQQPA